LVEEEQGPRRLGLVEEEEEEEEGEGEGEGEQRRDGADGGSMETPD
jgi:hypothetical protein